MQKRNEAGGEMCNFHVPRKNSTYLPKIKIISSVKENELNFRFVEMGSFSVYTQKMH